MAFKDKITGLFLRSRRREQETSPVTTPTPAVGGPEGSAATVYPMVEPTPAAPQAPTAERQELLGHLDDGFRQVGNVLVRLDEHLAASTTAVTEVQKRLPELVDRQHELIEQACEAGRANRAALEAFTENLQHRDEHQRETLKQLQALSQNLHDERDAHQRQLDLVMAMHRSGRRMLLSVFLIFILLFIFVLMALLAVALKLGPFKGETPALVPTAPAPMAAPTPARSAPVLDDDSVRRALGEAATSTDPAVRERAIRALERK